MVSWPLKAACKSPSTCFSFFLRDELHAASWALLPGSQGVLKLGAAQLNEAVTRFSTSVLHLDPCAVHKRIPCPELAVCLAF